MTEQRSGGEKAEQLKDEGRHLSNEVQERVGQLAHETGDELRHIVDDAKLKARSQADEQAKRAAETLRGLAGQLDSMAKGAEQKGPIVSFAHTGAERVERFADHLEQDGLQGVVNDVESFARRRPGLFLAASMGMGMALGRLYRASDTEQLKETMSSSEDSAAKAPIGESNSETEAAGLTEAQRLASRERRP